MQKRKTTEFPVTDWWLPTRILKHPEIFPTGFCSHAEHWYLALLVLFSDDRQLQTQGLRVIQKNAVAGRMDISKKVSAPGIIKSHAQSKGVKYDLGYESFLITQGPLAGTMAKITERKAVLRSNRPELRPVRPVIAHSELVPELEIDIDYYATVNGALANLLERVHSEILQKGYIQALLYYLKKSGAKHSPKQILLNQQILQEYLQ